MIEVKFQFHKGTIRTREFLPSWAVCFHFNSIKVRLEPGVPSVVGGVPPFQFHKGTIRTAGVPSVVGGVPPFQFHKGTIRTIFGLLSFVSAFAFQFHKGTIRTLASPQLVWGLPISIP